MDSDGLYVRKDRHPSRTLFYSKTPQHSTVYWFHNEVTRISSAKSIHTAPIGFAESYVYDKSQRKWLYDHIQRISRASVL